MATVVRAVGAGLPALLLALFALAPAAARDVGVDEFRTLARQAVQDPGALAELREVREIDGRAVDVDRVLGGAAGQELTDRLLLLADAGPGPRRIDAPAARDRAGEILSGRRFEHSRLPRPFRGVLEAAGDRLAALFDAVARRLPGRDATLWTIIAVAVCAAAALVALRLARRRTAVAVERSRAAAAAGGEDPRALERLAKEAEGRGDHEAAVRLRFRAGLLRLGVAGRITYRPSLTTGEVRRRVRSRAFPPLARAHDEIVYGGREASPEDADASRRGWTTVLTEERP